MKLKLGQKLLQERENRKMTQAEFAELLGMSQSTYARLERNESKADLEQIVKIAEVCNIPLQEFLPDFLSFYNQHNEAPSTIVLGNHVNNYYGKETADTAITNAKYENDINLLTNENHHLKNRIVLMEEQVRLLQNLLEKFTPHV